MTTIAIVSTALRKLHVQDRLTQEGASLLRVPSDSVVEFIGQTHNRIGVSGSWCGKKAGYHPWIKVKICGVEHEISTFYLT